ncbi:MAG: hypothetical protein Q9207_002201 [Kuettlingeria erythrocarpa]
MMQDPVHYPDPLKFNGFRFVDPQIYEHGAPPAFSATTQKRPSKLTDVKDEGNSWHVWGTGRMACSLVYVAFEHAA